VPLALAPGGGDLPRSSSTRSSSPGASSRVASGSLRTAVPALRGKPGAATFPYPTKQPGSNTRLRAAARQMDILVHSSRETDLFSDDVLVVDSTPVECRWSRTTVRQFELDGFSASGSCASHPPILLGAAAPPALHTRWPARRLRARWREGRRARGAARPARYRPGAAPARTGEGATPPLALSI
jgi:hypothetical protein